MKTKTKSFDEAVDAIATENPETTTAVATRPETALAAPTGADMQGEVDQDDIATPRLAIVQKVGELSEQFQPGSILLNKRVVLAPPQGTVKVTVVSGKKYYMEDLPFGSETRPRIFNSKVDLVTAGLTLDYNFETGEKPTAKSVLETLLLVRAPDGVEAPEFNITFGGVRYAIAQWIIGSPSAYRAAGKSLLSARTMYLTCFAEQEWELSVDKVKFGANMVYVPEVVACDKNQPEFIEWASQLLNN